MSSDLEFALHSYRDGEIGFDELAWRTEKDWRSLAYYLVSKWEIPPTVTADDVQQELLLGCWQHVSRWDPDRGVSLDRYVVWNACALAVAFIHRQRCALKRRDKSPSRHPVLLGALQDGIDQVASEDNGIVRYEAIESAIGSCGGQLARRCLTAFADAGDLDDATWNVFGRNDAMRRSMVRQAVEMAINAG